MIGRDGGRRWRRLRRTVLERDGWRCKRCGKAGVLEVDHVTPMQHGGAEWDSANLQVLCRGCHIAKTRSENTVYADPGRDAWRVLIDSRLSETS